jgi:hypothetical protein
VTTRDPARADAALAALSLSVALSIGLAACGAYDADPTTGPPPAAQTTSTGAASDGATASAVPTADDTEPEETVRIRITIGDRRFTARLDDSAAARDLVDQLPVTVEMTEHGGVEKTGRLPSPLSLDGQPEGADPDVGDLGYYAPGNDLVLYHGDQSYFPGIVVLGRLDGDAPARIAELEGSVTATVERV